MADAASRERDTRCVAFIKSASVALKIFSTYFCGFLSIIGNHVLCTWTMILCPFKKTCEFVCRSIVYLTT